jgi:diguanylate cyclase (GGDEF)-like protein/PAS domain S-box-containing protein
MIRRTIERDRTFASSRSVVVFALAALVPVALLAASSIALASNQVTGDVNRQVQTTASVSAVVMAQRTNALITLVQSYATRPSLVTAVTQGRGDDAVVESNLDSLAHAVPGISASFVASLKGTSLATYPLEPTVLGTNFSYRDWFTGLVATGHPYVSDAIVTKEAGNPLAVTITAYIEGSNAKPLDILGINYSLAYVQEFSSSIGRAQGVSLAVTDRTGTSLNTSNALGLISMSRDPRVKAALDGHSGFLDYAPRLAHGKRGAVELSAYAPVPSTGWAVVASVPKSVAFAGLGRLRDTVLLIALLLSLIIIGVVRFAVRSSRRRREFELVIQSRDRDLARILESTDEGYLAFDLAGVITSWNACSEELFGWPSAEILGKTLSTTLIPPRYRTTFDADFARYRVDPSTSLNGWRIDIAGLHRDGREIPMEMAFWSHESDEGFSAFVHDISERVASKLELETINRGLTEISLLDPLTNLGNRRSLERDLELLEAQAARYGHRSCVAIIDIDNFKGYNDAHGHLAGDDVIVAVARQLEQKKRTGDTVYRYGGDEFVCLLPEQSIESGTLAIERMSLGVQELALPHDGTASGFVTISAGLAVLEIGVLSTTAAVLHSADEALYRAKAQGRNQVVSS